MQLLRPETQEEIAAIAREKGCRLLAIEPSGVGRCRCSGWSSSARTAVPSRSRTAKRCRGRPRLSSMPPRRSPSYALEVSSAGLERKLYSLDDARRFVGRRVRVKTETPVVPEMSGTPAEAVGSRNLRGRLDSVEADVLRVVDEENRKTYNRFGDIRQARLEYEWPERRG